MATPTITLIAGFPASVGNSYMFFDVAANDVFDTNTFAPDVIEHDITAYGRKMAGLQITRGVQSIVTTGFGAQAGVLQTVLSNRDRRFDRQNLSGPYVDASVSKVVPNVAIILRTNYNAADYDVFYGWADGWPNQSPEHGRDQVVNLEATDATKKIANANINIRRDAEQSGERIQAVLTALGYQGATSIATGNTTVSALTRQSVSAWSHIMDCVNAEFGEIYVSKSNVLTFRGRDEVLSEARSVTSQATFGDAATELRYSEMEIAEPPAVNRVVVTYSDNGAQVTQEDLSSQGIRDLQAVTYQLPFADVRQAQQYADWIIERFADPLPTFQSITIASGRGVGVTSGANNLFPQAFGRELGDRITVKFTPLTGSRITADCFIRGITHNYSEGVWKSTKFTLQDASWTTEIMHFDVSGDNFDSGKVFGL